VPVEVGLADPLAVGVEDGGDQLAAGELLAGALQERAGQVGHVLRLDLAGDAEPEPAVAVQVGFDIAEEVAPVLLGPGGELAVGLGHAAPGKGVGLGGCGRRLRLGPAPPAVGDLVLDAPVGAVAGLQDRLAAGVIDRDRDRPVREVLPGAGEDALGQRQRILRRHRLIQLDPDLAPVLQGDRGLLHHAAGVLP